MQIVVNSLLTEYERLGTGPSIVLLHGWGDNHRSLQQLARRLARRFNVVSLDLPGFGSTASPPDIWGLDDYADFVAAFLKKLAVKPFVFIGHSNGGAIAVRGLARGKLHSDKLVLLSSAGIRNQYKGRIKVLRYLTKTGKAITTPLPKSVKSRLRAKVYTTIGSDMLVAEHLQETFKKVVTDDVLADASVIKLPVLLIYGDRDTATPPVYGKRFKQAFPQATLKLITGGGHFLHIEEPEAISTLIMDFLK